ncbi:MAG: hypothetical protein HYX53_01080 [Chloroflexi bacterium]|nr:hypothetical protein [Chloroflexota bacterium]
MEDRTGSTGDKALLNAIEKPLRRAAEDVSPSIPVVIRAGCPFDYPDGEVVSRDDPGKYAFQVYAETRVVPLDEPRADIEEQWFRGRSDSATPITFLVHLPAWLVNDETALREAFGRLLIADPTRQ